MLGHDFLPANLRQTPLAAPPVDVDFNGWWMCTDPDGSHP